MPPIGEVGNDDDGDVDGIGIIENISTLIDDNEIINNTSEPHQVDDDDATLSLSSATSATSIASTLSDGVPRPRSQSLNLPSTALTAARPNSTPRQRTSAPRSRPRSNPRTRTPMRHESPLLVTGRMDALSNIAAESGAHDVIANEASTVISGHGVVIAEENNGGESMIRNIFNTRRHRGRAGSIPEENEEFDEADGTAHQNGSAAATATASSAPRAAGHWLAQAASAPTTARSSRHRSTNPTRSRVIPGLSEKQRPSHRKLRRWNNDRFVGTSSEHIHITLENSEDGALDQYWREFYMPNYPREYRSEFAKLSTDDSKFGVSVRDRFLRGEVARDKNKNKGGTMKKKDDDGHTWMERSVLAKFHKLGISLPKTTTVDGQEEEDGKLLDDIIGKKLVQSLSSRIQSVLSRSCALLADKNDDVESCSNVASQVVAAFEGYLVSLALMGSKKDVTATLGYPPQQPQHVYDLFDEILCRPPKVVIRNKRHKVVSSSTKQLHHAVLVVPTVHFYFEADGGSGNKNDNGQVKSSSSFYRILLYAVCQFHGLESSSFVIAPPKKGKQRRRGQHCNNKQGGVKVVTVQGGVMLAPSLKLLDYVE